MRQETLAGHAAAPVTIDLCLPCQVFWFDARESLRLSPASTLTLFRWVGDRAGTKRSVSRPDDEKKPACPRCAARLVRTRDLQGSTKFEYRRCPAGHGRLTGFVDFLKEKNFVRALSAAQLAELKQHVQTVQCSNCGATVDLAKGSTCRHCRSPLSMLDLGQAGKLIEQLRQADTERASIDPALPLRLARARRQVNEAFREIDSDDLWLRDGSSANLVTEGLRYLGRLLERWRSKGDRRSPLQKGRS